MSRQITMRHALRAMIQLPRAIRDHVTGVFVTDDGAYGFVALATDHPDEVAAAVQALPGACPAPWRVRKDGAEQASVSVALTKRVSLVANRVRPAVIGQEAA